MPPADHHGANHDLAEYRKLSSQAGTYVRVPEAKADIAIRRHNLEEDRKDVETRVVVIRETTRFGDANTEDATENIP